MEEENPKLINGCMVEGDFIPCVFDDPDYNVDDCNYAPDLQRSGTGRDGCKYWKPDAIPSDVRAVDELTELRAENARLLQSALASQRDADNLLEKLHAAERERDEFKESYRLAMVSVNHAYDKGKETAEANIRAEIADGGKSCQWCLDTTTRKERERCLEIVQRQVTTVSVYATSAEAVAATEIRERIAAEIASGE